MDPIPHAGSPHRRQFARLGAAAYAVMTGRTARQALPNLFPNANGNQFRDVLENELYHLATATTLIRSLGGTPWPKPAFQNLAAPNALVVTIMSRMFENTGTGLSLPRVSSPSRCWRRPDRST